MVEHFPFIKRFRDWLNTPVEVKVFDLHKGITEAKNFPPFNISAEILEQIEPRTVSGHGNSLAVVVQKNWLTSICGNNPKGKEVKIKWLRLKGTKNECMILIEGIEKPKQKNGYAL